MLGDIKEIVDSNVFVNLSIDISKQTNLVDLHIIFEDGPAKVVGQIVSTTRTVLKANIVGEIKDNIFLPLVLSGKKYQEMERRLATIAEKLGITMLLRSRRMFPPMAVSSWLRLAALRVLLTMALVWKVCFSAWILRGRMENGHRLIWTPRKLHLVLVKAQAHR